MTMSTPFGALKQVDAGPLSVGYADAGPAGARAVMLLHGWPYDIHSFADVTGVPASINGAISPCQSHVAQSGVTPEHAGALGPSNGRADALNAQFNVLISPSTGLRHAAARMAIIDFAHDHICPDSPYG
jgi:pimeloyl-ACP methyl ester carboxylesterase